MQIEDLVEEVKIIAKNAGAAIMNIYTDADLSQVVDYKADDSPLTLADEAADKVIKKAWKNFQFNILFFPRKVKKCPLKKEKIGLHFGSLIHWMEL